MARHSGVMSKQSLKQLTKMDSFMKDCQRFDPLLLSQSEGSATPKVAAAPAPPAKEKKTAGRKPGATKKAD